MTMESTDYIVIKLQSEMVSKIKSHNSSWRTHTDFIRAVRLQHLP